MLAQHKKLKIRLFSRWLNFDFIYQKKKKKKQDEGNQQKRKTGKKIKGINKVNQNE